MRGLNGCLALIFGDYYALFCVYGPISPITLVLACLGFFISDLHLSSQVMGENNEVEAGWITEGCKRGPLSPRWKIQGKTRRPKRSTKTQRSGDGGTMGLETTMGCLWFSPRSVVVVARPCYLGLMAVRPLLLPVASVSFVPFCFPERFFQFLSFKR